MRCADGMGMRAAWGIFPNIQLILLSHKCSYFLALVEQTTVERAFGFKAYILENNVTF